MPLNKKTKPNQTKKPNKFSDANQTGGKSLICGSLEKKSEFWKLGPKVRFLEIEVKKSQVSGRWCQKKLVWQPCPQHCLYVLP